MGALVFALHHYRPTPLYVMDEIDAALDFKNVSIVANYIHQRTKNAQFVIISLRNNIDPELFKLPTNATSANATATANASATTQGAGPTKGHSSNVSQDQSNHNRKVLPDDAEEH